MKHMMVDWINQLRGKTWMTPTRLEEFNTLAPRALVWEK